MGFANRRADVWSGLTLSDELDALISRIEDAALRRDLNAQIRLLRRKRQFGLVFEEHLPELVNLPHHPIRRGVKVVLRGEPDAAPRMVLNVAAGEASLLDRDGNNESAPLSDLIAIADFGDPIFPGLRRLGSIHQGGSKPAHVVIKGENHHVLEALEFSHAGRIDCVYIDPPYNTGARDWKYNNHYVDAEDDYRHSKWLAFMHRRLVLAKKLLKPDRSVLLVTIDEKEVHRLGLLLDQTFPGSPKQMLTSVINPKGASLGRDFARVDEHIFVVYVGTAGVRAEVRDMLDAQKNEAADRTVKWSSLIRGGAQGIRTDSPGAYYPVFVDPTGPWIRSFGEALPWDVDQDDVPVPDGLIAVWPPSHPSGVEGRWGIGPEKAAELYELGALRLGRMNVDSGAYPMSYLSSGIMKKVASGEIETLGRKPDGALIVKYPENTKVTQPKTVWNMKSHNAGEYGSKLVTTLLPGRKFPFPKSLYAVEDLLRFFLANLPDSVVLDFFAGSGTTAHAVARLNRQDGGRRQSISVTNNEVSVSEARSLADQGFAPGDLEWEELGIFEHITRPRITSAFTGQTPGGVEVSGSYKFVDPFPMAEGFEENAEFLELVYLDADDIELDLAFAGIAPLLWLRAGCQGPLIEDLNHSGTERRAFAIGESYAILFDVDHWRPFIDALPGNLRAVFVVTDSPSEFAGVASELPHGLDVVRLYENYLSTFAIGRGGLS